MNGWDRDGGRAGRMRTWRVINVNLNYNIT